MQSKQTIISDKTPLWHSHTPQEVMQKLGSGDMGLSEAEAHVRLQQYGINLLKPPNKKAP